MSAPLNYKILYFYLSVLMETFIQEFVIERFIGKRKKMNSKSKLSMISLLIIVFITLSITYVCAAESLTIDAPSCGTVGDDITITILINS